MRRTSSNITNATVSAAITQLPPLPQDIANMKNAPSFSPKEIFAKLNVKFTSSSHEDSSTFFKFNDK